MPQADHTHPAPPATWSDGRLTALALALSLGAAISLGITRFSYGLLLPPMRADLGWSYTLAGAMNTANALGYLLGALATPWLLRRVGAGRLLLSGAVLASLFMGLSGLVTDAALLMVQRVLAGVASAFTFVAGGLLAAQLGAVRPACSGWLIGLYYGGTGLGIALSALLVPEALHAAQGRAHGWAWAWWALALACGCASAVLVWPARALQRLNGAANATAGEATPLRWRPLRFALAGYTLFGAGYIGYMTFVVALLRERGAGEHEVTVFYTLLGVAVVVSSRLWAGLLDRAKGGEALATLNALLGAATLLPALTAATPVVWVSGLVFGGVMLSVVASTTALVRHNLPAGHWAAGISAFTTVFAAGQIVGPTVVGWIADSAGGLARGLGVSAGALWLGAWLAWRQRPLPRAAPAAP